MTTQFLILRIQSIIDGNADMNPSQLRAIANEYKRVCEDAERKLVHCASLIKAGRDYAALQVAETEPLLLDTINELLFEKIEDWRTFCEVNSLPCPPAFNEYQIDLLKSLYTREISQTHPLYRDYRRAMRMHNYPEALSVIRTIAKVNKLDAQAKKECEKLERKVAGDKFAEAKQALANKDEERAVSIASTIGEIGKDIFASDPDWIKLSAKVEEFELRNAKNRLVEIVSKLRELESSDDYREILSLCAEFDLICSKYSLSANEADLEFVKSQTKRASSIQDEILKLQERANASIALAAEIEHPEELPPSKELLKLKELAAKSGELLENELKSRFEKRCAELKSQIRLARAKSGLVFCVLICALAAGAFYADKFAKDMKLREDAKRELSIMVEVSDDSKLREMIAKFESSYKDLLNQMEFSLPLSQIKEGFAQRSELEAKIKKDLDFVSKFDKKSRLDSDWNYAFEKLDEAEKGALAFSDARRSRIKDMANSLRRDLRNSMNELRSETSNALKSSLEKAADTLAKIDVLSDSAYGELNMANEELKKARQIADNPSKIFNISQLDADRLAELDGKLQTMSELIAKSKASFKAMLDASNLDEYFAELGRFKENPNLSAKELLEIENLEGIKDFIEKQVYGGFSRSVAENTPEKFSSAGIDFSGNDMVLEMYRCTDGTRVFYVSGKVQTRKQTWRGGSEITQTAMIIGSNGTATESVFRMNYTDGFPPRGRSIISSELSAESRLANAVAEVSQSDSPIRAIELVAKANANPMFKVWLEKKLFDALSSNEIKSGLAYSPALLERREKVEQLSKQLDAHSWIFATNSRVAFIKSELYSEEIPDFMKEAESNRQKALESAKNPMKFAGFVDSKEKIRLKESAKEPIYGISANGEWIEVTSSSPAEKFSPLFEK